MSGGCLRGSKPPRVDPNGLAAASSGAVLPTHVVPANSGDDTTAPDHVRTGTSTTLRVVAIVLLLGAALLLLLFGFWMPPVVSIDVVSATGLGDGKNSTISPSFDVAVRIDMSILHLIKDEFANGTVAVSCAGGAVTARGELQDVILSATSPSAAVSTTARAPSTALPGDARKRLIGELQRGELHLNVSVAYTRQDSCPFALFRYGFNAVGAVTMPLNQGNSATP